VTGNALVEAVEREEAEGGRQPLLAMQALLFDRVEGGDLGDAELPGGGLSHGVLPLWCLVESPVYDGGEPLIT
jgi:hypothetical protein